MTIPVWGALRDLVGRRPVIAVVAVVFVRKTRGSDLASAPRGWYPGPAAP
ncbi:hypothetical protein [Nocardiopsis sp. NPDC058789]